MTLQQQENAENNTINTKDEDDLADLPDNIKIKLTDLISKIDTIESIVKQFESKQLKEVTSTLSEIDAAKFNWINVYAINSLFFSYLKCCGKATKDHPIMNELGRCRNYMLRINEIVKKEEDKNKSKLVLDKDSSARLIKRSLWQHAQKAAQPASSNEDEEPQLKRLKSE